MLLKSINTSVFSTSGTDMFFNVQEKEWQKIYPTNEKGLCNWALRSLYIENEGKKVLIDTGFSNIDETALNDYDVKEFIDIFEFLDNRQLKIDEILLTHLHLDHCGGLLQVNQKNETLSYIQNRKLFISADQLHAALQPSAFEADSFQPNIVNSIAQAENLNLNLIKQDCFLYPWLELNIFNGHTEGMIIPVVHNQQYSLAFAGDLIPSAAHLSLNASMRYDVNSILALAERQEFLEEAFENEYILFFQHDYYYECCTLKKEGKKILPDKFFKLEDLELKQQ